MNKKTKAKIAVALGIISVLIILSATWSWALFGMSEDVGSAWVTTAIIFVVLTVVAAISSDLA